MMGQDINIAVYRNGIRQCSDVPVRLDNISPIVVAGLAGADPYNSYTLISLEGVPDIQNKDRLIDQAQMDTNTPSGNVEYRVNGSPAIYDEDHLEVMVVRITGKTP